ncbi:hypothetical protein [Amycolatopsis sp. NPDC004378]
MTGPDEAGGNRWRHAGQWIVLDARLHLLAIGPALYQGISPRLDVTARRILFPRMRAALADRVDRGPRTQVMEDFGRRWTVRVQPVLGPASGELLAVLGCYVPEHAELPDPPLVGGWEWHATPPGPGQQMRVYWSPDTFGVFGYPVPPGPGPHWWEAARWLDEVVAGAHRADIQRVLETFLTVTSDGLLIHTFAARTADGARVHLRMAGRRDVDGAGPDKWFRGIVTRVANDGSAPPPSTAAVLDAAFAVSADPLCAIDTSYEHIYMTSANFAGLGIELPPDRHLPTMAHPEDIETLRAFLEEAAKRPAETIGPVTVRLAAAGGTGWKRLAFTGTGMRLSASGPQHHVLCRVTPALG